MGLEGPGEFHLQAELGEVIRRRAARSPRHSATVAARESRGREVFWVLWASGVSSRLRAQLEDPHSVSSVLRECVGRGDWCGVGEQGKQKDDTCRLLPWFLCRAGAWALSSRSTACTLRWRSNSTSGQQEWGSFEARSFEAQAPAFTSLPPPLSMKMSLAPCVRLKRCPKVIGLELSANIRARAGI